MLKEGLSLSFQYPQTDRYPCNNLGSAALSSASMPFSILKRIDTPATAIQKATDIKNGILSVSSNGSIPLQRCNTPRDAPEPHFFQYPQTDRYPCNGFAIMVWIIAIGLSVSSNGSIPLQRLIAYARRIAVHSFQYPQTDRYPCNSLLRSE